MKKITKLVLISPIFLAMSSGLTSCGSDSLVERVTLKVINSEDYIFVDEDDPSNNMTEQFKRYVKQLVIDGELPEKFKYVDVVYDTSDTNETLYSELQTGKSDYDLINVSDYMAQKMVSEGLVVPLYMDEDGERREDKVPNYETYASATLRGRLDSITAPLNYKWVEDPVTHEKVHPYAELKDYAVGYMWGTLGILFNPEYNGFANRVESVGEVIEDMHYSFSALWNTKYNGTISIKNSMRDTFAAGLMCAYEEDFADLKAKLEDATYTPEQFMEEYAKVFNGDKEENFATVVNKVHNSLSTLKNNIFGLEVDSGKQDIVTGKIGINLAWSGDAVYSMDQAEDGNLVGENQSTLYYCVPELGSNLWFDTWVMPQNANRSEERRELALLFLDFMSDPANASQNMNYTGYTSFIGGGDILELVRDWYDIRTDEIYEEVEVKKYNYEYYQVYAVHDDEVEANKDFFALDYPDFMKDDGDPETDNHKSECDEYLLYYFVPYSYKDPDTKEIIYVDEPESVEDLLDTKHSHPVYLLDDEDEPTDQQKKYGDLTIVDQEYGPDEVVPYDIVDLGYFFNGTLDDSDYGEADTIFYSAKYYARNEDGEPYTFTVYDEDGNEIGEHTNNSVGRQFYTQYPDEATIIRCAVMKDFGENNKLVMKMWEEFKSDPLPTSSLVLFMVIIGAGVALGAYIIATKVAVKKIRKKRKMQK